MIDALPNHGGGEQRGGRRTGRGWWREVVGVSGSVVTVLE